MKGTFQIVVWAPGKDEPVFDRCLTAAQLAELDLNAAIRDRIEQAEAADARLAP